MTNRRTLVIPPELWDQLLQAAIAQSAREGRYVSVSEYVREAVLARMEREGGRDA